MAEPGTPLPLFSFPIYKTTEWDFSEGCDTPDSPAAEAKALTARIRTLDEVYRTGYIERGMICRRMDSQALWRYVLDPATKLPCHSFNAWLLAYAPWSRSDCYAAMATVEKLQDVPVANLVEIPRCNLRTLERVSTGVRSEPEVLRMASVLSENDFLTFLGHQHPSQHLEPRKRLRTLPATLLDLLDSTVAQAMEQGGFQTWEEGLESILSDWLASCASSSGS